jgi:SPP1 gp7 family putative phage head morphogenesis protein
MIARAQTDGLTFDRFQKSLEPYLKLAGWWGRTWERNEQGDLLDADGKPFPLDDNGEPIIPDGERPPLLGSPSRLATIYQTNLQVAFMAGRYVGMMEAVNARPYWQYISVRDGRTTDLCVSLDQQVYPADDPFWSYFYPPNHWRCRARVRSLSDRDLKRKQLDVSSSKGKLGSEQVVISKRTGETGDISTLQVGDHVLRNDPSFNYNPGKKAFEPDLKKYPKELQKAFKREKREKRK